MFKLEINYDSPAFKEMSDSEPMCGLLAVSPEIYKEMLEANAKAEAEIKGATYPTLNMFLLQHTRVVGDEPNGSALASKAWMSLLDWNEIEARIFANKQLGTNRVRLVRINHALPKVRVSNDDRLEFWTALTGYDDENITVAVKVVRNPTTVAGAGEDVVEGEFVFVQVDEAGNPVKHRFARS